MIWLVLGLVTGCSAGDPGFADQAPDVPYARPLYVELKGVSGDLFAEQVAWFHAVTGIPERETILGECPDKNADCVRAVADVANVAAEADCSPNCEADASSNDEDLILIRSGVFPSHQATVNIFRHEYIHTLLRAGGDGLDRNQHEVEKNVMFPDARAATCPGLSTVVMNALCSRWVCVDPSVECP